MGKAPELHSSYIGYVLTGIFVTAVGGFAAMLMWHTYKAPTEVSMKKDVPHLLPASSVNVPKLVPPDDRSVKPSMKSPPQIEFSPPKTDTFGTVPLDPNKIKPSFD